MVRGKFNGYVYFMLLIMLFFLIVSFYLLSHPHLELKGRNGRSTSAALVGVIVLLLAGFVFYVLAKVLYIITIEETNIRLTGVFKRRLIEKPEIRSINLFSRENLYWSAGSITIGTRIELNDGSSFVIADPFYYNIAAIKRSLFENFREKIKPSTIKKPFSVVQTPVEDNPEKIAGNPYTSLNGILIIGLFLFFSWIVLRDPTRIRLAHLVLLIPMVALYLGLGSQLYYFVIGNKQLIVKNHFLFWINEEYELDDIIEANFETPHRRSQSLRITSRDFRSKRYGAGSLRDRHWNKLREKFISYNIYFV